MIVSAVVQFRSLAPVLLAAVMTLGLGTAGSAWADVARGFGGGAELRLGDGPVESTGDWTYTVRPDDTLDELASRLLRSSRDADDLINYNRLGTAGSVSTGDAIRIPMSWLKRQPEPAVTLSVVGDAFFRTHLSNSNQPLRPGQELGIGDEIRTHAGTAIIELADGSRLELDRHTRLTFNRLTQYGRTGMADTRMQLEKGRIQSRVVPVEAEGSRFEVETPSAVAAVRGTDFGLEVEGNSTRLEVWEGEVLFGSGAEQQLVSAGQGAIQGPTGGPMVHPLPAAPSLAHSEPEVNALPTSIEWEHDNGVAETQVDLYRKDTDEWLVSRSVDQDEIRLDQLDNGEYRLHLSALGSDQMRGNPKILDFVVNLRAHPATLEAPDLNKTLDDPEPEFHWSLQGDNEEARVEVARDREFEEIVGRSEWREQESAILADPLEPGRYYWRVVTRAGGTSEANSMTGDFSVLGQLPDTRIITANAVGDQVNLYWNSLEDAEAYKLQLARDADFEEIAQELETSDTNARLQLRPGETYHIRVRGVAEYPLTSDWGASHEMKLE